MDILRRLLLLILLCLLQVLVLNRIQLFNCATPLLFLYFVITFPRNYPRWGILLWSFALGLGIDMFANTPGVTAASLTMAGMIQPYLIELFLPRDAEPDIKASTRTLGTWHFLSLASIIVVAFCLLFFLLESFTLSGLLFSLKCAGGSALLTLILIMTLETVRKK